MADLRVLVTGGTGLLGKTLFETRPGGMDVFSTHVRELPNSSLPGSFLRLQLKDRIEVMEVLDRVQPHVVIHTAGIGSVDAAQNSRSEAWATNVGGTQHIVEACHRHGSKLIYLSSNAVFDGNHPPYHEQSLRRPINYYGQLKVEAEDLVQASGLDCAIVRAVLMYGWPFPHARENPVTSWIRLLRHHQPVRVGDDRYWQPLSANDCARAVWQIVLNGKTGVYHVAGHDRLSLFEFALQACQVFALDASLVAPVPSTYFPEIAPRPIDTSFVIEKIQQELDVCPVGTLAGLKVMRSVMQ